MTRPVLVAAALLLALPAAARSQVHAHPRSGSESLGAVHFATSCSPSTAPRFDRGVALLHSFEFAEAIKSFNEVLASDSTCAMAHWGIALSLWTNPMAPGNRPASLLLRGRQESDMAKRIANGANERERGYIDAVARLYDDFEHTDQWSRVVAYERAMAELVRRQPADSEAAIFHAVSLIASASPTDKSYSKQREAGGVLEALWAKQPNHPGLAHYIIHAYDVPPLANRARTAARRYASIAPSAAHALHMPSHTFTRVGMWEASIETNKRSMKVAIATGAMPRRCTGPTTRCMPISSLAGLSRQRHCSANCRASPRASIQVPSPVQHPAWLVRSRWPRSRRAGRSSGAHGRKPRRSSRVPALFRSPKR